MYRINYIVMLMVLLAITPSCKRARLLEKEAMEQDSIKAELQDSLATAAAERDSLMALMNDIADGMTQIKEMQDIISVENLNGETPDRKQQLRNDILLIQQSLNDNKKRLAELERRLKQSTNYNSSMERAIKSMKQQLETQQRTIDDLTQQLAKAHIEIENLNRSVDSLNVVNKAVVEEKQQAQEETKRLTEKSNKLTEEVNELNTCYYVIGSKKELKEHKIIETGFLRKTKIMEGDFEKSYFTKADRRTLSEIPLHSKKAEVLSNHPEGSYEIMDHGNIKSLRIIDSSRFWEYSNYLVVKVD